MDKLLIFAGTYAQYLMFCKEKELQNAIYMSDVHVLHGIDNPKIVLVGTYTQRKDYPDILNALSRKNSVDFLDQKTLTKNKT